MDKKNKEKNLTHKITEKIKDKEKNKDNNKINTVNDKYISSDYSDRDQNINEIENEKELNTNFDNLSDYVGKIHIGIIILTISLFFSYSQSLRNKNLKDEEIPQSDIITGIIYMCLMIFSLIRIFNSYMSLNKEYEETIKNTKINKREFIICKFHKIIYILICKFYKYF
jgi:hypothetical protein